MRARVLFLGVGLALFVVVLTRGAGPGPGAAPPAPRPPPRARPAPETVPPSPAPMVPSRNPFRYGDEAVPERAPAAPASVTREPVAPSRAEGPVRLVGFLRRGRALGAALVLSGEVVTLKEGEEAEGYVVLSIDEEAGVRLRTPDGTEIVLPVPPN